MLAMSANIVEKDCFAKCYLKKTYLESGVKKFWAAWSRSESQNAAIPLWSRINKFPTPQLWPNQEDSRLCERGRTCTSFQKRSTTKSCKLVWSPWLATIYFKSAK